MTQYDLMESAVGVGIRSPLYDQNNDPFILDSDTDTVSFRWHFQGDPSSARTGTAQIVDSPSNIVEYVFQAGDLDQGGILVCHFIPNAPGKPANTPTEPITLEIGHLAGP